MFNLHANPVKLCWTLIGTLKPPPGQSVSGRVNAHQSSLVSMAQGIKLLHPKTIAFSGTSKRSQKKAEESHLYEQFSDLEA